MGPRRPLFNLSPQKGSEAPAPGGDSLQQGLHASPTFSCRSNRKQALPRPAPPPNEPGAAWRRGDGRGCLPQADVKNKFLVL